MHNMVTQVVATLEKVREAVVRTDVTRPRKAQPVVGAPGADKKAGRVGPRAAAQQRITSPASRSASPPPTRGGADDSRTAAQRAQISAQMAQGAGRVPQSPAGGNGTGRATPPIMRGNVNAIIDQTAREFINQLRVVKSAAIKRNSMAARDTADKAIISMEKKVGSQHLHTPGGRACLGARANLHAGSATPSPCSRWPCHVVPPPPPPPPACCRSRSSRQPSLSAALPPKRLWRTSWRSCR